MRVVAEHLLGPRNEVGQSVDVVEFGRAVAVIDHHFDAADVHAHRLGHAFGGGHDLCRRVEGPHRYRAALIAAGVGQFGSGWAWLSVKNGKLEISKTANGESPLVHGATPILGADVWEHSYYIDYRNKRPDYLGAWWKLANWAFAEKNFG